MTTATPDYKTYQLGNWELQCGKSIPDAFLAYKTFGDPKSPAVVYPSWYSGLISDNFWFIGEDKALNPQKYFVIVTALFGNGQSSSPSNTPALNPFPKVTFYDNVRAQHKLVTEHFGINHLRAVLGWSMGAGQTFQWITQYPDMVDVALPFCGSAKTSLHNQAMLEGVKSAVLAAKGLQSAGSTEVAVAAEEEPRTWTAEEKEVALKALGRVYSGWGFSQAWYRERLFEKHYGFSDLNSFITGFWETWACSKEPENMLLMLQTWQMGDVSNQEPYNGNFEMAMQSIKAKTIVAPSKNDLYFPPEDSEYEVANMRPGAGQLEVYPSIWGHWAGGPGGSVENVKWLDDHFRALLEQNPGRSG